MDLKLKDKMFLIKRTLSKTSVFTFLIGFILAALHFPTFAQSQSAKLESNVKKIVMMMNIVNKEYHEGIAEGKIINAAEYEESQIFLDQAFSRYKTLIEGKTPQDKPDELSNQFLLLIQKIKNKADPGVIKSGVNAINSGILAKFNIKLSETPSEPVSLENGRTLYMNNCKVCHGIEGKGDGCNWIPDQRYCPILNLPAMSFPSPTITFRSLTWALPIRRWWVGPTSFRRMNCGMSPISSERFPTKM
jgi:hypothetical protein